VSMGEIDGRRRIAIAPLGSVRDGDRERIHVFSSRRILEEPRRRRPSPNKGLQRNRAGLGRALRDLEERERGFALQTRRQAAFTRKRRAARASPPAGSAKAQGRSRLRTTKTRDDRLERAPRHRQRAEERPRRRHAQRSKRARRYEKARDWRDCSPSASRPWTSTALPPRAPLTPWPRQGPQGSVRRFGKRRRRPRAATPPRSRLFERGESETPSSRK